MNDHGFFVQFLKNWKTVGSITPSSRFLAQKIAQQIDFSRARNIVELGPGTGVITRELLARMDPAAKLYAIETNPEFCKALTSNINDPRLRVLHTSALHLPRYYRPQTVDYIVSGIPLTLLGKEETKNLINAGINVLKPGGRNIQYQYSLVSQELLESLFEEVDISFTLLNTPPAFIYTCNPRSTRKSVI